MDHGSMVDAAAANVLAHQEILMASPASSKLSSFYPNPSESECTIAQAVCNSGQLFIQANSKQIGGSADFMISTPNIMDCPQLNLSFKTVAVPDVISNGVNQTTRCYMGTYHDGWGFDCIESLEVSFANSNISNLTITGQAMRDWSLLQCKNADERKQMLRIAGKGEVWTRNVEKIMRATIPISFLFFRSAGGVKGGFGIDGRVLNGPITFQFRFARFNQFCAPVASIYNRPSFAAPYESRDATAAPNDATWPSSLLLPEADVPKTFETVELTMRTYQLMDGTFSVSKALEANPSLIYSIPSLWLNSYSQEVILDSAGQGTMNINSVPAGMIQAIIVRVRPVNDTADANVWDKPAAGAETDVNRIGGYNSMLNYNAGGPYFRPPSAAGGGAVVDGQTAAFRPYVPWSLPLNSIKLQYSGQSIYHTKTPQSHDAFTRNIFCDDLKTDICGLPLTQTVVGQVDDVIFVGGSGVGAATFVNKNYRITRADNVGNNGLVNHETQTLVIPLMHDGNSIFRNRAFENLPHYSGSTLQLTFDAAPYNTYNSDGTDRMLNDPATQLQFNYQQDRTEAIVYVSMQTPQVGAETPTWRAEQPAAKCASYPSNRLQRTAVAQPPTRQVRPYDTAAEADVGAPTTNQERVYFNSGYGQPNGAAAFSAAGGAIPGKVRVDLTYVVAALFQITNGVAELQL